MRGVFLGLALAGLLTGVAKAADYVVVASTAAAYRPGDELNAGARVDVGPGQTLTLIHASGDVTTVRGAAAGATVPARRATDEADANRMVGLKALIGPAPTGRTFGGRRSGVCPLAENLLTIDAILGARKAGCEAPAKAALEAYVAKAGGAPVSD